MSSRGGIILVHPAAAAEVIGLITDHGLTLECSLDGRENAYGPTIALVVTGDALPEGCESTSPAQVLQILVTVESYGSQRLRRISAITIDRVATRQFAESRFVGAHGGVE